MDAAEIAKRIEADRREWLSCDDFSFEIRRPANIDLIRLRDGCKTSAELNYRVAVHGIKDWKGIQLKHLFEGGDEEAADFDPALVDLFLSENMSIATAVAKRLFELFAERKAKEDTEKKA